MVRFTFSHCSVIIANRCICMVLSQQQQKHSVTSNTTQRKFVWKSLDTKRLSGSDDIWTNMDREVWWFQHMPPQPPSPFCYRGIITAQTCTTKKQSQKVFAMCSLIPQDSTVIPHWSAQLLNSTDKFNFLTWSVNIQKVFPRYVIPTQNTKLHFQVSEAFKANVKSSTVPSSRHAVSHVYKRSWTHSSWYFSSQN